MCVCGRGLHLLWLGDNTRRGVLRWEEVAYAASLGVLVRDDLILLGWLRTFDPAKNVPKEKKKEEKKKN